MSQRDVEPAVDPGTDRNPLPSAEPLSTSEALRSTANLVYLLQALSFVVGVTSIVGVVVNYLRLPDVRGTWLESHFVWQIRTFWFQLIWGLVGLVTSLLLIGFVIWGLVYLWTIYRVAKGWINLSEDRPMYAE